MSVGGERNVERIAVDSLQGREFAHHLDQTLPQQRLATRKPNFRDAETGEDARHAQVVGNRHLRKLRPIAARAAIDALVVTAIGDGDRRSLMRRPCLSCRNIAFRVIALALAFRHSVR